MAVLTATELETASRRAAQTRIVHWLKTDIRAALQAIEDAFQSTSNVGARSAKAYFAAAIETAAPGVFTLAEKDDLFSLWCVIHVRQGGFI